MKRILFITLTMTLTMTFSASAADFSHKGTFITIKPDSGAAQCIRLQVVTDNIIRVEQTPDAVIPKKKSSLVVVPQTRKVKYSQTDDGQYIYVKAARIQAKVNKKTGKVSIMDANGKLLLAEDGKSFKKFVSNQTELPEGYHPTSPDEINWESRTLEKEELRNISLEDRTGWSWSLQFDSPDDEAIYGLGQHQSEEMNYKGKNEELYQYNTKVSIPFVVSTKGYGLLWDSYSYGRWGRQTDWQQLCQAFKVYDKDGREGGIVGTYTDRFGRQTICQYDSIYFENSREIPRLPKGFQLRGAHVVYEGMIEAPQSAVYDFILYYAGYVKVYLDGHLVVPERWRTAWNPNAYKFDMALLKGRKTPLRIEWKPDGDVSYCGLRAARHDDMHAGQICIWAEMDKDIDYYVIAATPDDNVDDNANYVTQMDEIISGYRTLTGKAQVMPKWTFGFWQSRDHYRSQQQLEEVMQEFRTRKVPVDVIVQDWNYWEQDQWGSHEMDKSRFPDFRAMQDKVHNLGGRLMISCWPKFYVGTDHYKELSQNGWMYQQAVKDSIRDWVGPGYMGSFYDAYSAGARQLFWQQMDDHLYSGLGRGIDAWWMDASEPNVRDCTPIDYRKLLCGPTALGTSDEYFNAYSIVNADAIYTGQRRVNPDTRVFLLTRSGFAGEQRYSTATWSGDIAARWEDMRAQMTAGLNFSMAGVPMWCMDIGGYCVESRYSDAMHLSDQTGEENDDLKEWRELFTRWHQFACFAPIYRAHGQYPLREVWNTAPESHPAYQTILYYDKLRYHLMPYIYSMAGWVHFNDYTMMRGLAMDFQDDPQVYDIKDQWMFGPSLMACPVGEYKAREREVYLPAGTSGIPGISGQSGETGHSGNTGLWYDFYTGKSYQGGQTIIADAPYSKCPVFVRAGSIIPFGPELQYSDEKPAELINLYVYAGGNGRFSLYEDEGTNYNYEKGRYATIDILYDDTSRTVTFAKRQGSFDGMLQSRRFNIVLVSKATPRPLDLDHPQGTMIEYNGKEITIKLD